MLITTITIDTGVIITGITGSDDGEGGSLLFASEPSFLMAALPCALNNLRRLAPRPANGSDLWHDSVVDTARHLQAAETLEFSF